MFYEFSLMPDIFDPELLYCDQLAETVVTTLLDGMAHNGMIADLHKGRFRKHIGELVGAIPDEDPEQNRKSPRKDIQECLELLDARNRFVRHPKSQAGDPDPPADWLNLAMLSHAKLPFDGMVMCDDLYASAGMAGHAQAEVLSKALRAPFWIGRKPDVTLEKRKGQFAAALAPILRHAKAVSIIDPYINPGVKRWLNIIELLGQLVGRQANSGPSSWRPRIHIHAGDCTKEPGAPTPANRLNVWGQELDKLPRSFRVTVFIWGKDISKPDMHDRYVITNQCGITCPGGLDCYPDNSSSDEAKATSTWTLMGEDSRVQHLGEFDENTGLYRLLDKREFVPSGLG